MNHVSVSPTNWKWAHTRTEKNKCYTANVCINVIFSFHGLLPSDLVAQSVERRRSNPKVVGSIPTLFRVFLCPCVGPFPLVGLTLTWFKKSSTSHYTPFMFMGKWHLIQTQPHLSEVFKEPPILSYRKGKSLKDT